MHTLTAFTSLSDQIRLGSYFGPFPAASCGQPCACRCVCVWVWGWRLRLSGLTDVSRSNHVSAFRLKHTLTVFRSSRGAAVESSLDVSALMLARGVLASWCQLWQIYEPPGNGWCVTYGRSTSRLSHKILKQIIKNEWLSAQPHSAADPIECFIQLTAPPTSGMTCFNHSHTQFPHWKKHNVRQKLPPPERETVD